MRKCAAAWTLLLLLTGSLAGWPCDGAGDDHSVAGERGGPRAATYIQNVYELQNMSLDMNGSYELANDIDASATKEWNGGAGFMPVGNLTEPFDGTLDGGGFSILGLCINRTGQNHVGLFGCAGPAALVRSIHLSGGDIAGQSYIGALAGTNRGNISNCTGSVSVNGSGLRVGGLVGTNDGLVRGCASHGTVHNSENGDFTGGLVGANMGVIADSTSNASVNVSHSVSHAANGGFVGCNIGTIHACVNFGPVNLSGGGFAGTNSGTISDCLNRGPVERGTAGIVLGNYEGAIINCTNVGTVYSTSIAGGIVMYNYKGYVSNSTNTGQVKGSNYTSGGGVGGVVGWNDRGYISDCANLGPVNGLDSVGGLAGTTSGLISNCFSTGPVCGTANVGGLAGKNDGTVSRSYWDYQTSGTMTSAGGVCKTSAEMTRKATFVGWDFEAIWDIIEDRTYPFLRNLKGEPQGPHVKHSPAWSAVPADTELNAGDDFEFAARATDEDAGDSIIYSLASDPACGIAIHPSSGFISWPDVTVGIYSLNLTATDGSFEIWHRFNLTVVAENHPPVWFRVPIDCGLVEGENYSFRAEATDEDAGDTITYGIRSDPACAISVHSTSGIISWTDVSAGKYSISLTATDGRIGITYRFNLTVVAENHPPVWADVPRDAEMFECGGYAFTARATDEDPGTSIRYGLTSEPACGMFIDSMRGLMTWTEVQAGNYSINITASDGRASIWHKFNLSVGRYPEISCNEAGGDDYTFGYLQNGSRGLVTGSYGVKGKYAYVDILRLETSLDPGTGQVKVAMGMADDLRFGTVSYYICFVDGEHRQAGPLLNPQEHRQGGLVFDYFDPNHTDLYLSLNGKNSGSSSKYMPSLAVVTSGSNATFFFSKADLMNSAVKPGFGLYAMCVRLSGWPGAPSFNQVTWDSAGTGAADAPAEFNASGWDGLFGAGMFGSGSFPDAKGDDYTDSCEHQASSTLITESYGVKGRFPAADITGLKAAYDASTDNYTLTMTLAADPQFRASKPGVNTMYFFCIVDSGFVQPREGAPVLQGLSDQVLSAFMVDFMRGFMDLNHTLVSVFVGDDANGKVTSTPGLSFSSEGWNLSVVFDRTETCEGLRLRPGSFYAGQLSLFAYCLRMTEKEGKESGVLHSSWDTAGAGAVAPPPEVNAKAWEARFGKGKAVQPGMDPLLLPLLLVVMIVAAAAGAGGYVYVRRKRANEEEALLATEKAAAQPWVSPEDNAEQKTEKEWAEYEKMYGQPHPDSPEGIRRKAMQAEASADSRADTGPQPPQDGDEAPPAPASDGPAPEPPAQEKQAAPAPPQEGAPEEK